MSIPPCRDIWDIVHLATARRSGLVDVSGVSDGRLRYRLTLEGERYRKGEQATNTKEPTP